MLLESKDFGVFVGRMNPIHVGHERQIGRMIEEHGAANALIIIGSSNAPTSLRHFFPYRTRRSFIRELYPEIALAGLPDYHSDSDWLLALDDLISLTGRDPAAAIFYGGSDEDVRFFIEAGRLTKIGSRFDGSGIGTSATEVRDCLVQGRSIKHLVNPTVAPMIEAEFKARWEEFKNS